MKTRELAFLETTKRPQEIGDEGDKAKKAGKNGGGSAPGGLEALAFENSRSMV